MTYPSYSQKPMSAAQAKFLLALKIPPAVVNTLKGREAWHLLHEFVDGAQLPMGDAQQPSEAILDLVERLVELKFRDDQALRMSEGTAKMVLECVEASKTAQTATDSDELKQLGIPHEVLRRLRKDTIEAILYDLQPPRYPEPRPEASPRPQGPPRATEGYSGMTGWGTVEETFRCRPGHGSFNGQ